MKWNWWRNKKSVSIYAYNPRVENSKIYMWKTMKNKWLIINAAWFFCSYLTILNALYWHSKHVLHASLMSQQTENHWSNVYFLKIAKSKFKRSPKFIEFLPKQILKSASGWHQGDLRVFVGFTKRFHHLSPKSLLSRTFWWPQQNFRRRKNVTPT